MKEELEKLVVAGKIGRQHLDMLVELTSGGFCVHRSWGFGKITTLDTVFSRLTVDFQGKPGHSMDLSFAAESLKPIPVDHILARKASDLAGLRQMAALNHLDLIKLVIQSSGGRATIEQIQQVLVPEVITEDWKKWWEVAKRELKKDGHFLVPIKKSEPLVYQDEEITLDQRLLTDLRAAKGLKAKLIVTYEFIKNIPDISDKHGLAQEFVATLNADISSHQRTMSGLALEGIFARDEIRSTLELPAADGEVMDRDIWAQNPKSGQLLESLPAVKHRRALQSFRQSNPEEWSAVLLNALNSMSTKLCGECATLLIQEGGLASLKEQVARLISHHQASTELMLWLAKERSDAFADILGPEVFRAMMTAMERDQFNEKKSNRLRDFILDDQSLLVELIGSAELEVIKDLTRALQLSPCFDDMDKRSLLARIVKSYPAVQSLISGEHSKQDATLIVSWTSLERRRDEYADLVRKRIPANSKEIAIARSYGDLRENHEYKAAKETQKLLMRRKMELETDLVRARGTDFANPKIDVVGLGTTATITDLSNAQSEKLSIFGAWDSEPENGIISYLTPMAQGLLNRKVGEETEIELDGVKKRYRLEQIEVCEFRKPAEEVSKAVPQVSKEVSVGG
ncbi:MAG: GreA/GreB family elongation factor [Verrucomicrobia bacterium]|nr:GreA/GreB family elongation factor [Verrucomicrobiota bacterium]